MIRLMSRLFFALLAALALGTPARAAVDIQ